MALRHGSIRNAETGIIEHRTTACGWKQTNSQGNSKVIMRNNVKGTIQTGSRSKTERV